MQEQSLIYQTENIQPQIKVQKTQKYGISILFVASILIVITLLNQNSYDIQNQVDLLALIPSTFDLRVLPSSKNIDFSPIQQGVCIGASWALAISQTLSDIHSIKLNKPIRLSAQELLECSQNDYLEICHKIEKNNILSGLSFIQKNGLLQQNCYEFNPIANPGKCSQGCTNSSIQPGDRYFGNIIQLQRSQNIITNHLGNNGPLIMIIKNFDNINYYSSGILQNKGSFYGYLAFEVVGWKNRGEVLVVRSNFGSSWGYNGYADISLNDPTIEGFYGILPV